MATDSPLVHRTVRTGGVLLAVAAVQFVSVVLWVESRTPGFSWSHTNLLALGGASGVWAYVWDASLAVGGALAAVGLLFGWTAFDELPSRGLGILILFAGSLATVGVGALLAAGSHVPASAVSAAVYVAVLSTGLGLLVVSRAMHLHGRWRVSSGYTFLSGLVVLGAVVLHVARLSFTLGVGGIELLAVGAAVLWALVEGLHLTVLQRFAPGLPVKVAAA